MSSSRSVVVGFGTLPASFERKVACRINCDSAIDTAAVISRLKRKICYLTGVGIVINCLLFAVYRLVFLIRCAGSVTSADVMRVVLCGLRLDLALLGFELCALGLMIVLLRHLRLSRCFLWLWLLTALHLFICLANFFSFAERSQNAGDLILPYITSPYQVYLAVMPFCREHWLMMLGIVGGGAVYFWLGVRLSRRLKFGIDPVDLWKSQRVLAGAVVTALLPLMMTWQPIVKRKNTTRSMGITAIFANSKYYTHFSDFRVNEAVINPLFEFVGVQVPTQLNQKFRYQLDESEALKLWQQSEGLCLDRRYPLTSIIRGRADSHIENVVIVQVEGLSGSLMEQERNGRPVMPYLRQIAKEGIYFPNAFQNANFTSGGVFSTAVGVPKATWDETTRRFTSYELHGYYGSLAHTLGSSNYTHYFFEAFRQSGDDFLAFMSYQGCKCYDYQDFKNRLKARDQLADADSILGIHDGYFMQECAEMLAQCPTRFTAHLMTCTTHSPWVAPASFKPMFQEPELNTFAYLDASIEQFANRLWKIPGLREKTLLIVVGDHTSVTFGNNLLERLRIPLIFDAPGLSRFENAAGVWASQVDVLPTVLGLMNGDHLYGGMGRNLLDPLAPFTGVVSGTRDTGYFLTEDWVLQCRPFGGETRLFTVANGCAATENIAGQNPAELKHLKEEYFARVELARRLSLDKRIFPFSPYDFLQSSTTTPANTQPVAAVAR